MGSTIPWHMAAKKLTLAERNYSTLEKELLAIVWSVSKFRLYVAGKPFILQTDHQPRTFLNDAKFKNNLIRCWVSAFKMCDCTVKEFKQRTVYWQTTLTLIVIDLDEWQKFYLTCFVVCFCACVNNSDRFCFFFGNIPIFCGDIILNKKRGGGGV